MGDKVVDHAGIIQDAMDRQPLLASLPKEMMDYSYDEESGEYVIDNAGSAPEGDARFTRLSLLKSFMIYWVSTLTGLLELLTAPR